MGFEFADNSYAKIVFKINVMSHGTGTINRRASTLLLSLLILSVVLSITVVIAQIASSEIRLARAKSETMVATYAAESALEQGVFKARNFGATPASLAGTDDLSLGNGSAWSRQVLLSNGGLELVSLPKNSTRAFDLFDPDNGNGASGKRSVKLVITKDWDGSGTNCLGDEWVELGYVKYDLVSGTLGNFQKVRYNCPLGGNTMVNNTFDPNSAYRLYVRYVQGDLDVLNRLTITACTGLDGTGTCDMPGRMNIQAVGTFRNSSRVMNMDLPRSPPVSGIFDYAVFSECQIIKDPDNPNPPC